MEPVSRDCSIDGTHGPRSSWPVGSPACCRVIARFSGVQRNWTGSGVIVRGVSVCSVDSLATMCPPPLPRTSRIRPSCGSSSSSRTNSATNCAGLGTLKVKIRRWPKVPEAVSTLRARKTSGWVDGTSAPEAAAPERSPVRCCSTASGA
jgi:hypothetical protein